jgi:RNA polymerase-binding transcription factor DksA
MATRKPSRSRRKPKANSADVLGQAPANPRINPKWRKYYDRLTELRDMLLRSQGELTKDALEEVPSYSTHMADAGTDNYDRDLALGMLSSEQDAVYQIDQALERILDGTYGVCELTGKRIEPERLEAIPWTRFSTAAEAELERQGARKGPRLGPRETVKAAPGETSEEPG